MIRKYSLTFSLTQLISIKIDLFLNFFASLSILLYNYSERQTHQILIIQQVNYIVKYLVLNRLGVASWEM